MAPEAPRDAVGQILPPRHASRVLLRVRDQDGGTEDGQKHAYLYDLQHVTLECKPP